MWYYPYYLTSGKITLRSAPDSETQVGALSKIPGRTLKWLGDAEQLLEKLAPFCLAFVIAAFSVWAWFASRSKLIWFDELVSLAVATAPQAKDIVPWLASGIDFNPPLYHFVERVSVAGFGETALAARFPAFIGCVVLLICLYAFLSRRLGPLCGLVACLLFLSTGVRQYAWEGRPYGLVLGLTGIALLAYQRASEGRFRSVTIPLLAISMGCLLASHYYAALIVAVFMGAEFTRTACARRFDWPVITAIAIPPSLVLAALSSLITAHRFQLGHTHSVGSLGRFIYAYDILMLDQLCYPLGFILLPILLKLARNTTSGPSITPIPRELHLRTHEIALGIGLLLLPVIGAICALLVTRVYLTRYFLSAVIGLAILGGYLVWAAARFVPGAALLVTLALSLNLGVQFRRQVLASDRELPPVSQLGSGNEPILFEDPKDYLQSQFLFPSMASRFWYVAEPELSLRFRNFDTDDRLMLALASKKRLQVSTLDAFSKRSPHFKLVLARQPLLQYPLECLIPQNAEVKTFRLSGMWQYALDVNTPEGQTSFALRCSTAVNGFGASLP